MWRRLRWWPVPAEGLVSSRRGSFHQICAAGAPLAANGQCRWQGHDDVSNANEVRRWLLTGYKIKLLLLYLSFKRMIYVHRCCIICSLALRDIQKVLREDKEKLRQMQKSQPHFSSDQRRELVEEHPWMRRGGLPAAINVKVRTTSMHSRILSKTSEVESINIWDVCV